MSEGQALILSSREKRTPDELIAEGQVQAKALMKVVKEAGLSRDLGGNKPHLEVEAWQTIGRFNGYLTDIVWTRQVIEGGEKVGYEARAELVRIDDNVHVIGAEAACFFDEVIEKRDGTIIKRWDDDYAVRSMAQTRAQSKLGRMAFAWVAVLAGYSGTPAEEMEGVRNKGASKHIVFPFGKNKDLEPGALALHDLHKEKAFWEDKVAKETNPRFKANNERLLNSIKEAIAEKTAKPKSPAEEVGSQEKQANAGPDPSATAGDLSPVDQEWAKVWELVGSKGWTRAKVAVHCQHTYKHGFKEMELAEVSALKMYLLSV